MSLAQSQLMKDLLVVVDDFERALKAGKEADEQPDVAGFTMIAKSLDKILKKYGLQEIEQTDEFDPHLHEAVVQVDADDHESGAIVQVLQKGYQMKEQVLRPAKVSVAK